ncbi:MAG: glycoside hydrolase family 43 protein [Verrucomicrobia bacterium]|nr:glycoside hydrolase family 43 protein [Verrucomicrobiota bacterium]
MNHPAPGAFFVNPLLPKPSQDPYVVFRDGIYHAISTDGRVLYVRSAPDVIELYRREPTVVWTAPRRGPNSKHVWAPELHFVDGRWFIYYAADDGRNRNHRLWVLESAGSDPAGRYRSRGVLQTGGWAIDGTLGRDARGRLFLLWSGWPGPRPGPQNLYIAEMSDPATVKEARTLLTEPGEPWERRGAPVCEGPALLQRNGVTCVVYSASASWTPDHCLGLIVNRHGDFLDRAAWRKIGPVFEPTPEVWGIGHCSFITTHHGGDLIFYHAKTRLKHGWRDRNIRAQGFTWDADGLPQFGSPVSPGVPVAVGNHQSSTIDGAGVSPFKPRIS